MKKYTLLLFPFFCSFFSGCEKISTSQKQIVDPGVAVSSEKAADGLIVSESRCVGCGKCARIDSEHFATSGGKAIVISSDNMNSQELQRAIRSCPVNAISKN